MSLQLNLASMAAVRSRSRSRSSSSSSGSSSADTSSPESLAPDRALLKELQKDSAPGTMIVFHETEGLVKETLQLLQGSNGRKACVYNFMFTKELKKVKTLQDFVRALSAHILNIDTLVRLNRKEATEDLRRRGVPKGRLSRNVFAIRKRVAVWKDAIKSVEAMAKQDGATWTEGYRSMLYRRLIPAERNSWYCSHIVKTVQDRSTISSVPLPDDE